MEMLYSPLNPSMIVLTRVYHKLHKSELTPTMQCVNKTTKLHFRVKRVITPFLGVDVITRQI